MRARTNRSRGSGVQRQRVWYPIAYVITKTGAYTTTAETLARVFDRTRAFRLVTLKLEASASNVNGTARPFIIQVDAFDPISAVDTVFSSPLRLVPSAGTLRMRMRFPRDQVHWFPSETAASTPIFRLVVTCEYKDAKPLGIIQAYAQVELGPWEDDGGCPAATIRADEADDDDDAHSYEVV